MIPSNDQNVTDIKPSSDIKSTDTISNDNIGNLHNPGISNKKHKNIQNIEILKLEWENLRKLDEKNWMERLRNEEIQICKEIYDQHIIKYNIESKDLNRAINHSLELKNHLLKNVNIIDNELRDIQSKHYQIKESFHFEIEKLNLQIQQKKDNAKLLLENELNKTYHQTIQLKHINDEINRLKLQISNKEKEIQQIKNNYYNSHAMALFDETMKLQAQRSMIESNITNTKTSCLELSSEINKLTIEEKKLEKQLKIVMEKGNIQREISLENLRLEYMTREEEFLLNGNKDELFDIRKQLNQFREQMEISSLEHENELKIKTQEDEDLKRLREQLFSDVIFEEIIH